MNQILQGKPMMIFGDGEEQRAFRYIGDIAPIIACSPLLKTALNRIFNIGADQPNTVNKLANKIAEAMGVKPQVIHLPGRNEVCFAFSDHTASREVFGSIPCTQLQEGLHRMAAWVKQVGSRKSKEFKDIEIMQNLPHSWMSSD